MIDVAVVGAGMSGLVCAQQLRQAGYSVLVVEKSRGLGGRVATRRLHGTWADHGACYLKPKGEFFRQFVNLLSSHQVLEVWANELPNRYIAPAGMSACAKFLAQGLDVLLNQRVIAINPTTENTWRLTLESSDEELIAKAVVLAIPAPQALMLLEPLGADLLGTEFLNNLRSVEFTACISAIAGYSTNSQLLANWTAQTFADDPVLGWIGLDSSKRPNPQQPVFVVQSSASFAQIHLESTDLQPIGQKMLQQAAHTLGLAWLATPEWMQVHRWRYAFPSHPWQEPVLSASNSLPLVCCGDWCGGNLIEGAMLSGLAASEKMNKSLHQVDFYNVNFFKIFTA
ncbi:NAD(P)/FAD-dependent oxidoreductase [Nostoc sp. FACHB-110]|uniref:NAD(P)/FAD-dependent oxidoreductase n=1 Tax=Nostoc sp. FACHB-110 TaxID=2692834 RepID=UPI00168333CB|nr:FAD-dependent oxidoreductase [Nostoc sp. FACHB-110]MBD2439366.1 FAD-dependent oxidoreductase [Nostoc sp. FACHB-110]